MFGDIGEMAEAALDLAERAVQLTSFLCRAQNLGVQGRIKCFSVVRPLGSSGLSSPLRAVLLSSNLPWLCPDSSWTLVHPYNMQYPIADALKLDYILHEKSFLFDTPPVSCIWYSIFLALKEPADTAVPHSSCFQELGLFLCPRYPIFRQESSHCSMNESCHPMLLGTLLWPAVISPSSSAPFPMHSGEPKLQPLFTMWEDHCWSFPVWYSKSYSAALVQSTHLSVRCKLLNRKLLCKDQLKFLVRSICFRLLEWIYRYARLARAPGMKKKFPVLSLFSGVSLHLLKSRAMELASQLKKKKSIN